MEHSLGGHWRDTGDGFQSLDPMEPEPPAVVTTRREYMAHVRTCYTCLSRPRPVCPIADRLWEAYKATDPHRSSSGAPSTPSVQESA